MGSEMCIRDRHQSVSRATAHIIKPDQLQHQRNIITRAGKLCERSSWHQGHRSVCTTSAGRHRKSPAQLKNETFQPPKIVACVKRSKGYNAQQDQSIQQRKVTCSLKKQLSQATTAPAKPRKRSNIETPAASRGESSTNLIITDNPAECSVYNNIYLQTCVRE